MKRSALTLAIAALATLTPLALGERADAAALDPNIRMYTVETPHFRVNYPEGYDQVAKTAAGYAEEAHEVLSPFMKVVPVNRTELTLLDNEDTVNGFGFPLPNNQIFIYLTSPREDGPAWPYDAWLRDLLLHEYTHVLHLEQTEGLSAWVNRVFGRSYFPNMFEPIFLIEGLAVTTETRFSKGGRGRDAAYRMILRMAALEDKMASIDRASGYYTIEYPGGELPYIYGMAFYRHLMAHYGDTVPVALAKRIAHYPFFGIYGIDESLKEFTGKDAAGLWADMQAELKVDATIQAEAIRARGPLTPLTPVTDAGMYQRHPQYAPDGTLHWAGWDGHGYGFLYGREAQGTPRKEVSKGIFGRYAYSPDGRYMYHSRNWDQNRFTSYSDLFRFDKQERRFHRMSDRARLDEPTVSPDGRWVMAVRNGKGQTDLVKLRADGTGLKALTATTDYTQFSGPVWHPEKHLVAVSVWRDGSRDLALVDPDTGKLETLWRDRDQDINPTWSPDGRYLVFASDRTGVYNLYAYELETQQLFRMTNVMAGLLEPAVSPTMREVAAVSYSPKGFDVVTLPWDPGAWTPVPRPADEPGIRQPLPAVDASAFPVVHYDPLPSLTPKVWAPFAYTDGKGPLLGFTTIGQDSLMQHFLYGAFGYGVMTGRPYYQIGYSNEVLFPSLYAYAMDSTSTSYPVHEGTTHTITQRGLYQGLSVTFPGLPSVYLANNWVTGDTVGLGLNFGHVSLDAEPDPALPVSKRPRVGQVNTASVTYKFGDNYKFAYSISPEGGNLVT
ncbi:MAG: TolB family protein, partial [Candidatus Sericytochromatia bacterium]